MTNEMRPIIWAAYCSHGQPKPFINEFCIHSRREEVQKDIADGNRSSDEPWQLGWRRAYRQGWRAIKVRVIPIAKAKGEANPRS